MLAMSRFEFGKKKVATPCDQGFAIVFKGRVANRRDGSKPEGARLKGWDCFIFIVSWQQL